MKGLVYFIAILGLFLIGCKHVGEDNRTRSNLSTPQIDTVTIIEPSQVVAESTHASSNDTSKMRRAVMKWKYFYSYTDSAWRMLYEAQDKMSDSLARGFRHLSLSVSDFRDSIIDKNILSVSRTDSFDIRQYQFIIGFYLFRNGDQFANERLGSSLDQHFLNNIEDYNKLVKLIKDNFQSEYSSLMYNISESVFEGWVENEFDNLLAQGVDLNDFQSEKDNLYTLFKINHAFITDELEAADIDILDKY